MRSKPRNKGRIKPERDNKPEGGFMHKTIICGRVAALAIAAAGLPAMR